MVRDSMIARLAIAAYLFACIGCGNTHGRGDADRLSDAEDAAARPFDGGSDAGRSDATVDDAGADAGRGRLEFHVVVWADAEESVRLADAEWVVVGQDGSRQEGRTTSVGEATLSLPASGAPYQWTVAAPGQGARSLVGLSGELEAEVHLHAAVANPRPTVGDPVRVTISGLSSTERAMITGAGFFGIAWVDTNTLDGIWDPAAEDYSLIGVVYERRSVWLDRLDLSVPISGGATPALRGQVVISRTTTIPPSTVSVDLSTGVVPYEQETTIDLPTSGYFVPAIEYVEGFWGTRTDPRGPWFTHLIPHGANDLILDGAALRGPLTRFDEAELRWDEARISLRDGTGMVLGEVLLDFETNAAVIPPVDGPVTITGDSLSTVRLSASAPAWSTARVGLQQGFGPEPGTGFVSWIVVNNSGQLALTSFPELPGAFDLNTIGFDSGRATPLQAFIENTHDLEAGTPLRDVPRAPYVTGHAASEGAPRYTQEISWD